MMPVNHVDIPTHEYLELGTHGMDHTWNSSLHFDLYHTPVIFRDGIKMNVGEGCNSQSMFKLCEINTSCIREDGNDWNWVTAICSLK